jgi:nucleoside-diphosphate-sugar epimerase
MSSDHQTRVLIVGGAGYLGSVLTHRLLARNWRVRVLDSMLFGGQSLLGVWHHPSLEVMVGDIRKDNDVARALDGVSAVVHLAAIVGDPACAANPQVAADVNREGAHRVCAQAVHAGVARFVFASTCSNYGRMESEDGWVDEDSPLNPVSLYARLKVEFERYLLQLDVASMAPTCLRFATAFGLSPRPRFDLTVNQFARDLALNSPLEVYGRQFWRPYCHTIDIARAIELTLRAPADVVGYKAFNVGANDENYRKQDLIEKLKEHLPGCESLVSFVEKDEDPRDYRVRFDRFADAVGYQSRVSVDDGLREIVSAVKSGVVSDPYNRRYVNS